MTLSINIKPGQSVNGGLVLGVMTAAGNPWLVPDALANELVNRGVATANFVAQQSPTTVTSDGIVLTMPSGKPSPSAGFVPPTNDYAGILAAYTAAVAAGGGTIQLLPVTYNISQPLPIAQNIRYQGAGYGYTDNGINPKGGTVLFGDGTFPCFAWNATDQAFVSVAASQAGGTFGIAIKTMSIINFTYGIKFGALYASGVIEVALDELYVGGCTQWGVYLENCSAPNIGAVSCMGNAVGNFYMGSSVTGWNYGDGAIKQLYVQAGMNGANLRGSIQSKGIQFEARGGNSSLNDIFVGQIGVNGWGGAIYSSAAALTSGNSNIPVTDLSQFAVDSGVTFGSTVGNIAQSVAYFVVSKSASTGAGTIQIGNTVGGNPIVPSASGTPTLVCKGGTLLQVAGRGDTSAFTGQITGMTIAHSDVEQCGTVGTLLQNCVYLRYSADASSKNNGLVLRSVGAYNVLTVTDSNTIIDGDGSSRKCTLIGSRPLTSLGALPGGFMWNDAVDGIGLHLACTGTREPDIYGGDSSGFLSVNLNTPLAMYHQQQPSGMGLYSSGPKQNTGQVITYNGAGGGNLTLPLLSYAYQLGLPIYISNPSAGNLTINTISAQNIVGGGASATSYVIPANTNAMFMGRQNGGTYYWGLNG